MEAIWCQHCGKANFASVRGLTQHQNQGICAQLIAAELNAAESGSGDDSVSLASASEEADPFIRPPRRPVKAAVASSELEESLKSHDIDAVTLKMATLLHLDDGPADDSSEDDDDFRGYPHDPDPSDTISEESDATDSEEMIAPNLPGKDPIVPDGPNTQIRDQFAEYARYQAANHVSFDPDEVAAIRLLDILKTKKAPLNAYQTLMTWHLKESGLLHEGQSVKDYEGYVGRKTMLDRLKKRYNMEDKMPYQRTIKLPISKTVVKITVHDVGGCIQRLLTDPRIKDEDYLFFDDDPMAPPPPDLEFYADLNTGDSFQKTYWKLITKVGQQLMPFILYMDGSPVSHFHNMEITAVKIALGIHTQKARMKDYCWEIVGFVEKIHEQGGRGQKIALEANHLETQDAQNLEEDAYDAEEMDGEGTHKEQDLHAQLSVILEGMVDLQENGFMWDLKYKGKVYANIHYMTYVAFFKCDTVEADHLCAKYQMRHGEVKQLCRYCHIPREDTANHLAKPRPKTQSEIEKLVLKGDLAGLKAISQIYLLNAFHKVRFSQANDRGIHGACPSEMLHALLLGVFKYLRDIFFSFMGDSSELAKQINALATLFCTEFGRQSDRTMPATNFSRGIKVGKLMATEYRGVLLIMLAILRSTSGREQMSKKKSFNTAEIIDDWILLVELLLQWEAYLNEKVMSKVHVARLETKHRYLMYIMRKVAKHTKGMGLKLMKFHAIIHAVGDIKLNGVPTEFDTSANESHHKPAKQAAKLTQMAANTFQFQTATRIVEFLLVALAMAEVDNGTKLWEYLDEYEEDPVPEMEVPEPTEATDGPEITTGGATIEVFEDDDGIPSFNIVSRSKFAKETRWNPELVEFLWALQVKVSGRLPNYSLPINTCHKRDDQIFRGHPNYWGKGPWKDWVWVNWGGGEGKLPCHIWCFVTLQDLPLRGGHLEHGGVQLKDGVYAVVECATLETDEAEIGRSDLMMPIDKEVDFDDDGFVSKRTFYLADVEAFYGPCCVIPDIGGPKNRYFVVKPRSEWAGDFTKWLMDPHNLDKMDPISSDEEEEEVVEEEVFDPDHQTATTKKKAKTGKKRKPKKKT